MTFLDETIISLLGRPIAFNPVFARIGGGAAAGVMLSQGWYWTPRTKDAADGWFYKSEAEWTAETGLSRSEIETTRKALIKRGLMKAEKRGVPYRWYYRLNQDAILKAIKGLSENHTHGGSENLKRGRSDTLQTSLPETGKLISKDDDSPESGADQFAGFRQTELPETGKLEPQKPVNWSAGSRQTGLPGTGKHSKNTSEITPETTQRITTTMRATPQPKPGRKASVVVDAVDKNADAPLILTNSSLADVDSSDTACVGNAALAVDLSAQSAAPPPLQMLETAPPSGFTSLVDVVAATAAGAETSAPVHAAASRALLVGAKIKEPALTRLAAAHAADYIQRKINLCRAGAFGEGVGPGMLIKAIEGDWVQEQAAQKAEEERKEREARNSEVYSSREAQVKQDEARRLAEWERLPPDPKEAIRQRALDTIPDFMRKRGSGAVLEGAINSAIIQVMAEEEKR